MVTEPPDARESADDELRLVLLTCHPALDSSAQTALALRLGLGVETEEIARLFLVSKATMAARITRAKKKIATAGLPLALPTGSALDQRVRVAVEVAYLCFTAGYAPGSGESIVRSELANQAIRLARPLADSRAGEADGARAALALMLLQHARRDARTDPDGLPIMLVAQDRTRWHRHEIAEGLRLLASLQPTRGRAEELRLQAQIAAAHARAADATSTDWYAIARDYAALDGLTGSPVVRLNRAVAVAEAFGPRQGLHLLAGLDEHVPRNHRVPAVRAELLNRLGERDAARAEWVRAIGLCAHPAERQFLQRAIDQADGQAPRSSR